MNKSQQKREGEVCVLLSGGIDSAACVAFHVQRSEKLYAAFIDYGQKSARRERLAAHRIARYYGLPLREFAWTGSRRAKSGLILGRNAFFVTAVLMEITQDTRIISLGIHSGTRYPDCSPSFVQTMQTLTDDYTKGSVRITAPFLRWLKVDIWKFCKRSEVPLELTYSCEYGLDQPCGRCPSCRDLQALYAARRSTLNHPLGFGVDLPRLVPSFTSKGFPFITSRGKQKKEISEANDALEIAGPIISDSILVSAYDIYKGYFKKPETYFGNKEIVFIDSGGYELSQDFDSSEARVYPHSPDMDYDQSSYIDVLDSLPSEFPIVVSNFDHKGKGLPLAEQIIEAQALLNKFGSFLHDFIIKPSGSARYISIENIEADIDDLRKFAIVGVTEKELGPTPLQRMVNIAKLRNALNRHSLNAPIHVWGGLDPVLTPLYFLSGAEVFDGVSWLRYGYINDTAVSREAYSAIQFGVQALRARAGAMRLANNISYLETLTTRLRRFVDDGGKNFKILEGVSKTAEAAYNTLRTKITFA